MDDLSGLMWTTSQQQKPSIQQQKSSTPSPMNSTRSSVSSPMIPGNVGQSISAQQQRPNQYTPSYSVGVSNMSPLMSNPSTTPSMSVPRYAPTTSNVSPVQNQINPGGLSVFSQMNASGKNSGSSINNMGSMGKKNGMRNICQYDIVDSDAFHGLVSFGSEKKVDLSKMSLADQQKYKQQQMSNSNLNSPASLSSPATPNVSYQSSSTPSSAQSSSSTSKVPTSASQQHNPQAWDFDAMLNTAPTSTSLKQEKHQSVDPLENFFSGASEAKPSSSSPVPAATKSPTSDDPFAIFNTPAKPVQQQQPQPPQSQLQPPQPQPKKETSSPPLPPRANDASIDELTSRMVEIGFSAEDSKLALERNNHNYQAAVEWLLQQQTLSQQSPYASQGQLSGKPDLASKISKMTGLSQKRAEKAGQLLNAATEAGFNLFNKAKNLVAGQQQTQQAKGKYLEDEYYQQEQFTRMSVGSSRESLQLEQPTRPSPVQKPRRTQPKVTCNPDQVAVSDSFKTQGNSLFKQGQYGDAEAEYCKAIEALPGGHLMLIPLLNNRAAARLKTGQYKECIQDCTAVFEMCSEELKYDDNSQDQSQEYKDSISKALLRRATAFENIEKWEDAGKDYKVALEFNPGAKGASEGIRRCAKANKPEVLDRPAVVEEQKPSGIADLVDFVQQAPSTQKPTSSALNDLEMFEQEARKPAFKSENVEKLRQLDAEKEREDAEKLKAKDGVDAKLLNWKVGKEKNLRALISSVDTVLWPEIKADWKPVNMSELVTPSQVKIKYMKVIAKLHPDKLSNMNLSAEQKLLANGIFGSLNDAWDAFKVQNNI